MARPRGLIRVGGPIEIHADSAANHALPNTGERRYELPMANDQRTELWENAFTANQLMWGLEPTRSAVFASDHFARSGVKDVLIPGVGYGRNARPFLEHGMSVVGIEISETAIALSRSQLGLDIPIHHGSVESMPYDDRTYDGIFCYGLLHLLDASGRAKLLRDCVAQLTSGGQMIFTVISKEAPQYGRGPRLGEDWYETHPGVKIFYYDASSIERELGPYGLIEQRKSDEPGPSGGMLPCITAVCRKA